MKAILEFDFEKSGEETAFMLAKNGAQLSYQLDDFQQWMRNLIKHTEKETWPDLEQVREKLWEFLRDE